MPGEVVWMHPPVAPGGAGVSCVIRETPCGVAWLVDVHSKTGRARFIFHDEEEVRAFGRAVVEGQMPALAGGGAV